MVAPRRFLNLSLTFREPAGDHADERDEKSSFRAWRRRRARPLL